LGLSISVDGESLVAGAANDDKNAGLDAGSAYVFTRTGSTWAEQAKLRSTQAQSNERFGQSVSIEGDEALVGAYCLSSGTPPCLGSGAAYVFKRTAGVWASQQRIAIGANEDRVGHSVAHGNNGIAIAGAFGVDASNSNQGGVYALIGLTEDIFRNGFEDPALR
jgi:FG-GAP repeat